MQKLPPWKGYRERQKNTNFWCYMRYFFYFFCICSYFIFYWKFNAFNLNQISMHTFFFSFSRVPNIFIRKNFLRPNEQIHFCGSHTKLKSWKQACQLIKASTEYRVNHEHQRLLWHFSRLLSVLAQWKWFNYCAFR